jgi:hypothetical protein
MLLSYLIVFQLAAASVTVPGQIDRVCQPTGYCDVLVVQDDVVKLIAPEPLPKNLVVGNYIRADQSLVPRREAPIRDLRSRRGWRVVVSASLDHDEGSIRLHLRFFAPNGALRATDELLSELVSTEIGTLFGGTDEIFAVDSNEEHAYNDQTEIWFLPETGKPRVLLEFPGGFRKPTATTPGTAPGIIVDRQTYDGVNAETKGTVQEFYVWDPKAKSLTLQKQ